MLGKEKGLGGILNAKGVFNAPLKYKYSPK